MLVGIISVLKNSGIGLKKNHEYNWPREGWMDVKEGWMEGWLMNHSVITCVVKKEKRQRLERIIPRSGGDKNKV